MKTFAESPIRRAALTTIAMGLAVGAVACGDAATTPTVGSSGTPAACVAGSVRASGSTALQPLVQKASDAYKASCPGASVTVAGGGSSVGLAAVAAGGPDDIGDSDVPVSNAKSIDGSTLTDHQVAVVVFAVVVNPAAGVRNLTAAQIRDVFSGKVTNWKDVGGNDVPVSLIERKTGSGTRLAFDKDMMNGTPESTTPASTQDSTQLVVSGVASAQSPGAVSYINVASVANGIVAVSIDGVAAGPDGVKNGTYPFYAHEHMYTKSGSDAALSFIHFILTDASQNGFVSSLGYLPVAVTNAQSAADR